MGFPKDFTPKQGGKYTMNNLESGQSVKIRIMSDFIVGQVVWSDPLPGEEKGKPFRAPETEQIPSSKIGTNKFNGEKNPVRQFIAAIAYNYSSGQFEIFETDKQSIIQELWKYDQDPSWGSASQYDIKISKTGTGKSTRYMVNVMPPAELPDSILEEFNDVKINLKALLENKDPFNSSEDGTSDEISVDEIASALNGNTR